MRSARRAGPGSAGFALPSWKIMQPSAKKSSFFRRLFLFSAKALCGSLDKNLFEQGKAHKNRKRLCYGFARYSRIFLLTPATGCAKIFLFTCSNGAAGEGAFQ
ncbi:hypothetical protein [Gemmiger sp.]|uniref:hypothetical protein n=1 Tax=Gemmiger sp. TaxID=2049027 RepID=UPI002A914D67|nr:hypothetical protein [Gemmiger sp.]